MALRASMAGYDKPTPRAFPKVGSPGWHDVQYREEVVRKAPISVRRLPRRFDEPMDHGSFQSPASDSVFLFVDRKVAEDCSSVQYSTNEGPVRISPKVGRGK